MLLCCMFVGREQACNIFNILKQSNICLYFHVCTVPDQSHDIAGTLDVLPFPALRYPLTHCCVACLWVGSRPVTYSICVIGLEDALMKQSPLR